MIAHFGLGYGNPFSDATIKGFNDACALLNASCQWMGDWDTGWSDMAKRWDEALALNPDGIGTTITEPDVIRSHAEQAEERGIPVIIFNVARGRELESSLPALLYIGSDEFISGQTNARRVFAQASADGVTIQRGVCTNQLLNAPGLVARCAGVKSVFDEQGVPLDLIPISSMDSIPAGAREIADYFGEHPEANAIFALGPSPASSLNLYIQQAGLQPRQLYATGFDTVPEILQMIRDGYLLQTIDQQPYMQGFQTIISLYLYHQYGLRPSGFINTSSVVDRSNVDSVAQLVELGYR